MPLTEKELLARDAKRDFGAELLQSIREMKTGKGQVAYRFKVPNATTNDSGAHHVDATLKQLATVRRKAAL
jgi:hypothetical protein